MTFLLEEKQEKLAKVARMFAQQLQDIQAPVSDPANAAHASLLERIKATSAPKTRKASKREQKLQDKLRKVDKMVSQYGFSTTAACKEAKVSREAAKKWLGARKHPEEEVKVEFAKQSMGLKKEQLLELSKSFIDARHGNVFIKDIQGHLQQRTETHVPLTTLGKWVKKHIGYTYKKCSIMTPDIRQTVFVEHQA